MMTSVFMRVLLHVGPGRSLPDRRERDRSGLIHGRHAYQGARLGTLVVMGMTATDARPRLAPVSVLPEPSPADLLEASRRGDPEGWSGHRRPLRAAGVVGGPQLPLRRLDHRRRRPDGVAAPGREPRPDPRRRPPALVARHDLPARVLLGRDAPRSGGRRRRRRRSAAPPQPTRGRGRRRLLVGRVPPEVLAAFGRLPTGASSCSASSAPTRRSGYQVISELTGRPIGSLGPRGSAASTSSAP